MSPWSGYEWQFLSFMGNKHAKRTIRCEGLYRYFFALFFRNVVYEEFILLTGYRIKQFQCCVFSVVMLISNMFVEILLRRGALEIRAIYCGRLFSN